MKKVTDYYLNGAFVKRVEKEKIIINEDKQKEMEKEMEKINEAELQDYINKLKKEPLKLGLSHAGFPLCPVCNEEFKNEEEIICHLKANKKEFDNLADGFIFDGAEQGKNKWIGDLRKGNYYFKFGKLDFIHPKDIKEVMKNRMVRIRLKNKINEQKYQEWRKQEKKSYRENPVPPKVRFEILKRDNFTCQYCGKKAPEVILEVDHIEPYSKTKNNHPDNLITACKDCNRGKRTKEVV